MLYKLISFIYTPTHFNFCFVISMFCQCRNSVHAEINILVFVLFVFVFVFVFAPVCQRLIAMSKQQIKYAIRQTLVYTHVQPVQRFTDEMHYRRTNRTFFVLRAIIAFMIVAVL